MLHFKKIITTFFVTGLLLTSVNSFAFNLPKEFTSMRINELHSGLLHTDYPMSRKDRPARAATIKMILMAQYAKWKGTRYRWGGKSRSGIDCSALMQNIFNDSFSMNLPRTTLQQIKKGSMVEKDSLKIGDLIFFKTQPDVRHVGVYIGNEEFIHASSSKGVTISSLAHEYWDVHYETARRIMM